MKIAFFFLKILLLTPFSALGFFIPQGPLAISLGGSGRAVVQKGAEYHLLNPATVVHTTGRLKSEGFYIFEAGGKPDYWGISLMENSQLPLALSYIRERDSNNQYIVLSTSAYILPDFSLGASLARATEFEDSYWNVQVGLLVRPPGGSFSLGATWEHLLPVQEGVFKDLEQWAVAGAYDFKNWLSLRLDGIYSSQNKWTVAGGLELTFSDFLVFRGGIARQFKAEAWEFSGGLGVKAQQISVDYSLSRLEEKNWRQGISISGNF